MTDWFIVVEKRAPGRIERTTGAKKPKRDNQGIFTEEQENSTEISGLGKAVVREKRHKVSRETRKQVSQVVFNTLMM